MVHKLKEPGCPGGLWCGRFCSRPGTARTAGRMPRYGNPAELSDPILGSQATLSGRRFARSSMSGPQRAAGGKAAHVAPPAAAARRPIFRSCQVRNFFNFPKIFGGGCPESIFLFASALHSTEPFAVNQKSRCCSAGPRLPGSHDLCPAA